ncbi:hypothetical protein Trydic_g15527 [Trypoxylus dichotomus]
MRMTDSPDDHIERSTDLENRPPVLIAAVPLPLDMQAVSGEGNSPSLLLALSGYYILQLCVYKTQLEYKERRKPLGVNMVQSCLLRLNIHANIS